MFLPCNLHLLPVAAVYHTIVLHAGVACNQRHNSLNLSILCVCVWERDHFAPESWIIWWNKNDDRCSFLLFMHLHVFISPVSDYRPVKRMCITSHLLERWFWQINHPIAALSILINSEWCTITHGLEHRQHVCLFWEKAEAEIGNSNVEGERRTAYASVCVSVCLEELHWI